RSVLPAWVGQPDGAWAGPLPDPPSAITSARASHSKGDRTPMMRRPRARGGRPACRSRGSGVVEAGAAQIADGFECGLARVRETDALRAGQDHRVDAGRLAALGDQRSAAVAWVDRGVGLQEPAVSLHSGSGKDARGDGVGEAGRIADAVDALTDRE